MHLLILGIVGLISSCNHGGGYADDDYYGYDSGWDSGYDDAPPIESARYSWTGDTWVTTEGVGFVDQRTVMVGMGSNSCTFNALGGGMESDINLAEQPDIITDVDEVVVITSEEDETAVMTTPTGVRVHERVIPGLIEARHDGEGDLVAVADDPEEGCSVAWHDERRRTLVPFLNEDCELPRGFAVDRENRRVWVPGDEGIVEVTREGAMPLGLAGDLLAWDSAAQVLYVAVAGESTVWAIEPGGEIRWDIDLDAPVEHLTAMGTKGAAAVSVQDDDYTIRLVILDGADGMPSDGGLVHEAVIDVVSNPRGNRLAVVTADRILYLKEK